jgi:hypothetical protein
MIAYIAVSLISIAVGAYAGFRYAKSKFAAGIGAVVSSVEKL